MERAIATGSRVLQIFVKNNSRWIGKEIPPGEARAFRAAARRAGLSRVTAHTSYLINLASPSADLRRLSVAALAEEMERCHALGIRDLVHHPGAHCGEGETTSIARIAAGLDEAFGRAAAPRVRVLLETAAGQGSCVGHRFEHLRDVIGASRNLRRLAVCLDTCHVHAAGYDIVSQTGYEETLAAFDRTVGLAKLAAIHVNDSKTEQGSRVDRHQHIGKGTIGERGFRNLMTDRRLEGVPKFLETPKDENLDFDRANLATLRRLAKPRFQARSAVVSRGQTKPRRLQGS